MADLPFQAPTVATRLDSNCFYGWPMFGDCITVACLFEVLCQDIFTCGSYKFVLQKLAQGCFFIIRDNTLICLYIVSYPLPRISGSLSINGKLLYYKN